MQNEHGKVLKAHGMKEEHDKEHKQENGPRRKRKRRRHELGQRRHLATT